MVHTGAANNHQRRVEGRERAREQPEGRENREPPMLEVCQPSHRPKVSVGASEALPLFFQAAWTQPLPAGLPSQHSPPAQLRPLVLVPPLAVRPRVALVVRRHLGTEQGANTVGRERATGRTMHECEGPAQTC